MCLFRMTAAEERGKVALENSRRRREFLGGGEVSRGILPREFLKSRGSEMIFSTFSIRYFSKNLNLDKV